METEDEALWANLWKQVHIVSEWFPDGAVFIGGIAVYLHTMAARPVRARSPIPRAGDPWMEFSHDADMYIGFTDLTDLRDLENLTPNRRLSKTQFIKSGAEFDVYVERQHTLRVKYDDAVTNSTVIDHVRVACLEHLLLLKIDAYNDRKGSAKGDKDQRDIVRIVHALQRSMHNKRFAGYATYDDITALDVTSKSTELRAMAKTPREAADLREEFAEVISAMASEVA
jgi:hypothetical protein